MHMSLGGLRPEVATDKKCLCVFMIIKTIRQRRLTLYRSRNRINLKNLNNDFEYSLKIDFFMI